MFQVFQSHTRPTLEFTAHGTTLTPGILPLHTFLPSHLPTRVGCCMPHSHRILFDHRSQEPRLPHGCGLPSNLLIIVRVELQLSYQLDDMLPLTPLRPSVVETCEELQEGNVPDALVIGVHSVRAAPFGGVLERAVVVHFVQELAENRRLRTPGRESAIVK